LRQPSNTAAGEATGNLLCQISNVTMPIWRQVLQQFERACHDQNKRRDPNEVMRV
jgi:hypothetical protein